MSDQEQMMTETKRDAEVQAAESNPDMDLLKSELLKRTEECTSLRVHLETKAIEQLEANTRISQLEHDKKSYMSWMQRSAAQSTAQLNSEKDELERKIARLRDEERTLRDTLGNVMFLQGQIDYLTKEVSVLDSTKRELLQAKLKIASLESIITKWKVAAQPHGILNPCALTSFMASAFQNEANASAAASLTQNRLAQLTQEIATLKSERNKVVSDCENLEALKKYHENLISDLKSRLALHDKDRQRTNLVVDAYNTELMVALSRRGVDVTALASRRVVETEKLLREFRDVMIIFKQSDSTTMAENLCNIENKWRSEKVRLQSELDAALVQRDAVQEQRDLLKEQRDVLQKEIEHLTALCLPKVKPQPEGLSLEAQMKLKEDFEIAKDEIRMLKIELRDAGAGSSHNDELQHLQQQLEKSHKTIERLRKDIIETGEDFQAVCLALLGYKIEKSGYRSYRISSAYAETSDQFLLFTMDDCDMATMIQTDYSASLGHIAEVHVHDYHQRSIPLFLASLTMELFTRRTVQQVH